MAFTEDLFHLTGVRLSMLQKILRTIFVLVFVFCLVQPAQAATELPSTNPAGDYNRTSHRYWVVVDPDPKGVNCRWSASAPQEWYRPDAQFETNFGKWDVVHRYERNQALLANITPAGFALINDSNNKPWLKVSLGNNDQICLVRANAKYIRPYEKE